MRQAEPEEIPEPSELEKDIVKCVVILKREAVSYHRPKKSLEDHNFENSTNEELIGALQQLERRGVVRLDPTYVFEGWLWKKRCGYVVDQDKAREFAETYALINEDTDCPELDEHFPGVDIADS